MPYEPRRISFLSRTGRLKHYGIASKDRDPERYLERALDPVAV